MSDSDYSDSRSAFTEGFNYLCGEEGFPNGQLSTPGKEAVKKIVDNEWVIPGIEKSANTNKWVGNFCYAVGVISTAAVLIESYSKFVTPPIGISGKPLGEVILIGSTAILSGLSYGMGIWNRREGKKTLKSVQHAKQIIDANSSNRS